MELLFVLDSTIGMSDLTKKKHPYEQMLSNRNHAVLRRFDCGIKMAQIIPYPLFMTYFVFLQNLLQMFISFSYIFFL